MCGRGRITEESLGRLYDLSQSLNWFLKNLPAEPDADLIENSGGETAGGSGNRIVLSKRFCSENFMPGMETLIITKDGLQKAKWGLLTQKYLDALPPDARPNYFRMNNARSERLEEIHSKRIGLGDNSPRKRCIAVFDGFYEWKSRLDVLTGKTYKQPYYIHQDTPMIFAGLFEEVVLNGESVNTFTVITLPSSSPLQWLHHRMPAVLDEYEAGCWLAEKWTSAKRVLHSEEKVNFYPVDRRMNSTSYQGLDCSQKIDLEYKRKRLVTIDNFLSKPKTKQSKTESKSSTDFPLASEGKMNSSTPSAFKEEKQLKDEKGCDLVDLT